MTEELQRCSRCKCNKLLINFKMRENTEQFYKTCIICSEKFKCDFEDCKYTCSQKSNLKQHIKQAHDKIKDIKCNLCSFKCSTNSNLKHHIKAVHNKIKSFKCESCEFICSQKSDLKQHIKQIHDKIKDFK